MFECLRSSHTLLNIAIEQRLYKLFCTVRNVFPVLFVERNLVLLDYSCNTKLDN